MAALGAQGGGYETLRAKQYYSNIESSVLRFFTTRLTQSSDRIAEERYITCQRKARTPDPLKRLGLTDIGSILWGRTHV